MQSFNNTKKKTKAMSQMALISKNQVQFKVFIPEIN